MLRLKKRESIINYGNYRSFGFNKYERTIFHLRERIPRSRHFIFFFPPFSFALQPGSAGTIRGECNDRTSVKLVSCSRLWKIRNNRGKESRTLLRYYGHQRPFISLAFHALVLHGGVRYIM